MDPTAGPGDGPDDLYVRQSQDDILDIIGQHGPSFVLVALSLVLKGSSAALVSSSALGEDECSPEEMDEIVGASGVMCAILAEKLAGVSICFRDASTGPDGNTADPHDAIVVQLWHDDGGSPAKD